MSIAALNFLAGLGGGYFQGQDLQYTRERQQKLDAQQTELHDAQMDEVRRKQAAEAALADAAKPVTAKPAALLTGLSANGPAEYADADVAASDVREARNAAEATGTPTPDTTITPKFSAGDKLYDTQDQATSAAAAANAPDAMIGRQVAAMRGFDPVGALDMQSKAFALNTAQQERARQYREENVSDALRAFRSGDAAGMADAFNKSGLYKIVGTPELTPEMRTIPGLEKPQQTYNATMTVAGPDGQPVVKTFNSHDLSMATMPYDKALDLATKATTAQGTAAYHQLMADASGKRADAAVQNANTNTKLSEGTMTDDAVLSAAVRYNIDGTLPPMGMGKNASQQRQAVLNMAAKIQKENGLSPEDQRIAQLAGGSAKSALTKLMTTQATVGAFEKTFNANSKLVQEYSSKVDRTGVPVINRWLQAGKRSITGDADLAAYDQAIKSAANEYAKIISGSMGNTAVAEGEIKKINDLLNAAQTPQQVDAVLGVMRRETANRMAGFDQQKNELIGGLRQAKPGGAAPGASGAIPRVSSVADAMKLPSGTVFIDPNGVQRTRP